MEGVEKEINDESKIRVFDCSSLNKLAIYTHDFYLPSGGTTVASKAGQLALGQQIISDVNRYEPLALYDQQCHEGYLLFLQHHVFEFYGTWKQKNGGSLVDFSTHVVW